MGILEQIRTRKFRELPFGTKAITVAVNLGLVLILIMVLGAGPCVTQQELTIGVQGEGTVTGAGTHESGQGVSIGANPADGWKFVSWSGGTVADRYSQYTTVAVEVDTEITAIFTQLLQYTLTIKVQGNGSAFSSGTYSEGEVVIITTIPAPDWKFVSWSGDTITVNDTALGSTTIIMDGDKEITANFSEIPSSTTPPEIPTSGIGAAGVSIYSNPGSHPSLMPAMLELTWNIADSTITITGIPGVSEVTGTLEEDGTFSAMGDGSYSGYSTSYTFNGTITPGGISGMLSIGDDGGLPGGEAIVYEIELTFP